VGEIGADLDVDAVARDALSESASLPDVRRVGIALCEGGGRRLRFLSADSAGSAASSWCDIDAYDDVPLTVVVRTGEPILGDLDRLEPRFPDVVARQRDEGTRAMAAVPLPGPDPGSPIGGLVVFFDRRQEFTDAQLLALQDLARRTSEAVRRAQAGSTSLEEPGDSPAIPTDVATMVLENDPRAPGRARRFVRHMLDEWEVEEDVSDTAQLCVSELVTNAVIHTGSRSVLTVSHDPDELWVAVRDHGGPHPTPGAAAELVDEDQLQVFGRGLQLVDALVDRCGSDRDDRGTTSWFAIHLEDAEAATS
jgi:anti-sigma regulatory factor (Ser/Thr protein kinase)